MKDKLTIKQSKRLIKLGVDPSKASDSIEVPCGNMICHEKVFNLTDILSLMPRQIGDYELLMLAYSMGHNAAYAHFRENHHGKLVIDDVIGYMFYTNELIDALFELFEYCIENNHLKV